MSKYNEICHLFSVQMIKFLHSWYISIYIRYWTRIIFLQNAYPSSSGILYTIQLQSLEALLCQIDQIDEHCRYRLSCLTESTGGGGATGGAGGDSPDTLSLDVARERPLLEATRMSSTESSSSSRSSASVSAFSALATADGGAKASEDDESDQQHDGQLQQQRQEQGGSTSDRGDDAELASIRPFRASRIRVNRMPVQSPLPNPELLTAQKRRKNVLLFSNKSCCIVHTNSWWSVDQCQLMWLQYFICCIWNKFDSEANSTAATVMYRTLHLVEDARINSPRDNSSFERKSRSLWFLCVSLAHVPQYSTA